MPITLITGANSGMGWASAQALARLGHDLILCVRSPEAMAAGATTLARRHPDRRILIEKVDLASLASVYDTAAQIIAPGFQPDNLLFNAGIMTPPYALTEDGFELQFQVNYLGHFALFQALHAGLPTETIKRVVSISSLSSEKATNDSLDRFRAVARCRAEAYDALKCYREAKLAQVMFTRSLDERFGKEGLLSASVHPGIVNTNLFYRRVGPVAKAMLQPLAWLGYLSGRVVSPAKGSVTAVGLVSDPLSRGGLYWHAGRVHPHNPLVDDRELCDALWNWSMEVVTGA